MSQIDISLDGLNYTLRRFVDNRSAKISHRK